MRLRRYSSVGKVESPSGKVAYKYNIKLLSIIGDNALSAPLKVRLEKCCRLHAKIQVVLVVAEGSRKVRFRLEFWPLKSLSCS